MSSSQRFIALDVLRGMTICFMIIVNTPGNGATTFSPLHHAHWHGFTPTDLVFPSFLFVTGNALSFVMLKWVNQQPGQVVWKIVKRTLLIFLLGYLMYWFPFFKLDDDNHIVSFPVSHTRIMGVLQRIALCYGFAALMLYFLKPKLTVIISIILLFLYWALLYWFGDAGDPLSMTGNAGIKLDKWLMGEHHMYHGEGIAFDPEGWLSTLPAIGNVVGGYIAGRFVQRHARPPARLSNSGDDAVRSYEGLTKLLLAGVGLLFIAYCWNLLFPINKKLWTSSFVVLTVGLDCIILAAIIYVTDFLQKTGWTRFFQVFGKNPLFIYLLSELLVTVLFMIPADPDTSLFQWIYRHIFSLAGAYLGSLLFAIAYMLLCWSVGFWLDKKKIYVRV
jgi:predicted acyltransferase